MLRVIVFLITVEIGWALLCSNISVGDFGRVTGIVDYSRWTRREFCSFRGIPFAEKPIGNLRFAPPVAIRAWDTDHLDAMAFGNICPQTKQLGYDVESYDEDCLQLNVYVPGGVRRENFLPVIIWLHGGGFVSGHARRYEPHYFMESNVILVVPQFRLGILGLLAAETEEIPGNVQFLDQIEAMKWVQDNIVHFGGNKNSVTLAGQSSGGMAVSYHLLNPHLTKGLFHRTIVQSSSILTPTSIDRVPARTISDIAGRLNCSTTSNATLSLCLKSLSTKEILVGFDRYVSEKSPNGSDSYGGNRPIVQRTGSIQFLRDEPRVLISRGNFLKLPMITGTVEQEGSYLTADVYDMLSSRNLLNDSQFLCNDLVPMVLKLMGIPNEKNVISKQLMEKYFPSKNRISFLDMAPGITDIMGMYAYKNGTYQIARENSRYRTTYLYSFEYRGSRTRFGYESGKKYPFDGGVAHSNDNMYLFPFPDNLTERDTRMARKMVAYWTSFAYQEIPLVVGDIEWPTFSDDSGLYSKIDEKTSLGSDYTEEFITNVNDLGSSTASNFCSTLNRVATIFFVCILRLTSS